MSCTEKRTCFESRAERDLPWRLSRKIADKKSGEQAMNGARLKHYGWGREGEGMTAEEQAFVLDRYRAKFARDAFETIAVPRLEDLVMRAPRVNPPASLAAFCTSERYHRAA